MNGHSTCPITIVRPAAAGRGAEVTKGARHREGSIRRIDVMKQLANMYWRCGECRPTHSLP